MDPDFERRWREARGLENAGDAGAAKDIYEALILEDPGRLYVRIRLSAIEQASGHYRAACTHALRCAEDVRGGRWKDLAAVTRLLLGFDEWTLVRELIHAADWSMPELIRDSAVLSQHLWLVGDVPGALRMTEGVLPLAPDNVRLRHSRANALRYLGRMDEATAEYERCLAIDPADAYVHWSLAFHQKSLVPRGRVERIRAAMRGHRAEAAEQAYLHYALFKEFDDAGDVEEAWQHLARGSAIKRGQVRYDASAEAGGFEALHAGFPTHVDRARGQSGAAGHVPLFIVGMPRSGTTLLERILGGHSRVASGGELNDVQRVLNWEADCFPGHFATRPVVERMLRVDASAAGRTYIERTGHLARGRSHVVDKNPANFIHAGFIARALPQARIVCLRRNPMDACFSNLKNLFANDAYGYSYALQELADYYARFDRLSRHWSDVLAGQYLEVDYESLVADPSGQARRVMEFCGLGFEDEAVDITRNTSPVTTASSSQVRQPINSRGVGAWRRYEAWLEPLRARLEDQRSSTSMAGGEETRVRPG